MPPHEMGLVALPPPATRSGDDSLEAAREHPPVPRRADRARPPPQGPGGRLAARVDEDLVEALGEPPGRAVRGPREERDAGGGDGAAPDPERRLPRLEH